MKNKIRFYNNAWKEKFQYKSTKKRDNYLDYVYYWKILFHNEIQKVLKECDVILDVGCGRGRDLIHPEKLQIGLDISLEVINKAKEENNNAHFLIGDVYNLPFHKKSVDLIISSEVIEHLTKKEQLLFSNELSRVSKKYVIITTPNRNRIMRLCGKFIPSRIKGPLAYLLGFPTGRITTSPNWHEYELSKSEIIKIFEGFSQSRILGWGYFFPHRFFNRYMSKLFYFIDNPRSTFLKDTLIIVLAK